MNGAQMLLECLKKEGVEVIFGYPGGAVLPIFDRLYDFPIRFVLTRHEQAAAHAADGYARATGRIGVCLATSGPGATNLTTGIATAYMDSVPLLAITGQVRTSLIGVDAFQEADMTGITRSITKHNYRVQDVRELCSVVHEACAICRTGRPGPVLIDLPVDVQSLKPDPGPAIHARPLSAGDGPAIPDLILDQAGQMIGSAAAPVIICGGGVITASASPELRALAERSMIPVTSTLMGLGGFPGTHPLYLGMLGMHGTFFANQAVMNADLVIAVGMRFDDRVTGRIDRFAPRARIIHIDIDPTSIAKNVRCDLAIVGDAKSVLAGLAQRVKRGRSPEAWRQAIAAWKQGHPLTYDRGPGKIKPQYVIEEIYRLTRGKAIITTEVGQNQMWATQWYQYDEPRTFISSGGLGTMGFGLPAAIGAKVGRPNKDVINIAGDGSIQMNIQELATCVSYGLNVKVAILNNGCLGMVRQWQELFYRQRYSQTMLANPDFVKIAEGFGALGIRVSNQRDVRTALAAALADERPTFIDFRVDPSENVLPMVPAGEPLDNMMEYDKE